MRIVPIPCLSDNYAYLLVCRETKEAAIIDPSEAGPVLSAIDSGAGTQDSRKDVSTAVSREDVRISAILCTHHHGDHVGGNEEVRSKLGIDRDGARVIEVGRLTVRVLHIPGHTLGALAYVVTQEPDVPAVFTGDTLFVAGAGRLFEGDPLMMHASLAKLSALDPRTRVYCGHEYTESNLRFAASIEPSNAAIEQARTRAAELRKEGRSTMGASIADELSYNPFLRPDSAEIRSSLGISSAASSAEALGLIRRAKDNLSAAGPPPGAHRPA